MKCSVHLASGDDLGDDAERTDRFAGLLHECRQDLFAFIFSLVQHRADAEDVFQQTTLVLWSKFDEFIPGTNFAAWSTRVAHLTARDFLRSRRRSIPCFSDELLESIASAYRPLGRDGHATRSEALAQCLEKLSRKDRGLVELCYSRERNFVEIAKSEQRSVGAVYQALCRIRKNLYRCVCRALAMESQ